MLKIKILCDINIILDVLLKRDDFFDNSYKILSLINSGEIIGYLSGISIDTIAYILKKNGKTTKDIQFILKELLTIFNIADINKSVILNGINMDFEDIEDSLQYSSAIFAGCDYLITRNTKDFIKGIQIKILSPDEFLNK